MPTYPAILSSNNPVHSWSTLLGLFTKFPSYPSVDTVLADLDGGATAYCHLVLTSGGVFFVEASYHGAYCRANLTPHLHLLPDRWYWLTAAMGATDQSVTGAPNQNATFGLIGQAFDYGGTTDGPQWVSASPGGYTDTLACRLAWGVSLNAAYGHQRNEPGRLIAHPQISAHNTVVDSLAAGFTPPTADVVCASFDPAGLYYAAREAVGPSALLHATCGSVDMDSGPNGLTIVRDAPY